MKVALRAGVIALFFAASSLAAQGTSYQQAPSLDAQVTAGTLPPVEKRLPDEPVVVKEEEAVGQYGGTLRTWDTGFDTGSCLESNLRQGSSYQFVYRNPRTTKFEPNILSDWKLSDDYKTISVTLRKGLRWSDGEPVTSADILFWWEDVQLNKDLYPDVDRSFVTVDASGTATPLQVIVDDDQTARFVFAQANPGFLDKFAQNAYLLPKHYLSQFLPKYNPQADEQAKSAGFDGWAAYYQSRSDGNAQTNPDLPQLRAWVLQSIDTSSSRVYVRNPYFWKVDSDNNQLPYIDSFDRVVVESPQVGFAQTLTGDFNFAAIDLNDVPLASAQADAGNFTVQLFPMASAADGFAFGFNYTDPDPELRAVFNDLRFRQAISYSINRDEWNQLFHAGLGVPRQGIPGPDTSFYTPGIDKYYTEYDVAKANQLLDEAGLKWTPGEDYRRLPSGKPFVIQASVLQEAANKWQVLAGYWKAIGVGLDYQPVTTELLGQQLQTNTLHIGSWGGGGAGEFFAHSTRPIRYEPPWHFPTLAQGGALWGIWHDTNGAQGEEPPEIIKHLFKDVDEWLQQPYGSERYLELGREILQINAENLWWFGIVGYDPTAWIVGKGFHNLPPAETRNPTDVCGAFGDYLPEQFWISDTAS